MKKAFGLLMVTVAALTAVFTANVACAEEAAPQVTAFSAYLTDSVSGRVLYAKNEDEKHEIASMVKIMTATLTFEALERGELSLEEKICVSETAASMGGSQMFLDAGVEYKAGDLLKGVIVASANDASVALAERIGGSHSAFVGLMNKRAAELGMKNTLFSCATGLPDSGEQYSTARDVNIMTRELMKHKGYYDYAGIWMEDFIHPSGRSTQLVNTNKLIRNYAGCVGGKTGFTDEAGFCLSACAERNGVRVTATLIGGKDGKGRFAEVSGMFNYAFANFKNVKLVTAGEELGTVAVSGGKLKELPFGAAADISCLLKNSEQTAPPVITLPEKVKAPVARGDVIGSAEYSLPDGRRVSVDLVALSGVEKSSIWDIIKDIFD